jgi:hypothetical protein
VLVLDLLGPLRVGNSPSCLSGLGTFPSVDRLTRFAPERGPPPFNRERRSTADTDKGF